MLVSVDGVRAGLCSRGVAAGGVEERNRWGLRVCGNGGVGKEGGGGRGEKRKRVTVVTYPIYCVAARVLGACDIRVVYPIHASTRATTSRRRQRLTFVEPDLFIIASQRVLPIQGSFAQICCSLSLCVAWCDRGTPLHLRPCICPDFILIGNCQGPDIFSAHTTPLLSPHERLEERLLVEVRGDEAREVGRPHQRTEHARGCRDPLLHAFKTALRNTIDFQRIGAVCRGATSAHAQAGYTSCTHVTRADAPD